MQQMTAKVIDVPFRALHNLRGAEKFMLEAHKAGQGDFTRGIKNSKEVYRKLVDEALGRGPVD